MSHSNVLTFNSNKRTIRLKLDFKKNVDVAFYVSICQYETWGYKRLTFMFRSYRDMRAFYVQLFLLKINKKIVAL